MEYDDKLYYLWTYRVTEASSNLEVCARAVYKERPSLCYQEVYNSVVINLASVALLNSEHWKQIKWTHST